MGVKGKKQKGKKSLAECHLPIFFLPFYLFTFLKIFLHPPESSGIPERTGRRCSSSSSFSPCPDCSHSMPFLSVPARNEPPYPGFHSPSHCAGYRKPSVPKGKPPGRKDDDPVYINRCYARLPPDYSDTGSYPAVHP